MKRLLEAELIYGRLMTVTEPHLIGRYNKALKGFGLPETQIAMWSRGHRCGVRIRKGQQGREV